MRFLLVLLVIFLCVATARAETYIDFVKIAGQETVVVEFSDKKYFIPLTKEEYLAAQEDNSLVVKKVCNVIGKCKDNLHN